MDLKGGEGDFIRNLKPKLSSFEKLAFDYQWRQILVCTRAWPHFQTYLCNSVRQTDSALSNLILNIHGHVEVPKRKFFLKK